VLQRAAAWLLVAAWGCMTAGLLLLSQPSTLDELEHRVAAGEVSSVQVQGPLPRGRGYTVVTLRWRSGLFGYTTDVLVASPGVKVPAQVRDDVSAVVRGRLEDRLTAADADLRIELAEPAGMTFTMLGWDVPGWTGLAMTLVWVGTVLRLVFEERLRRATRWAWFWFVLLTPPVGPLAFLLLGGPTSGDGPAPATRLTGGWAFLLALALGAALGAVA